MRFLVFKALPKSLQTKSIAQAALYRPQVAFLDFVPKKGKCKVEPQEQSKRYLREKSEQEKRARKMENDHDNLDYDLGGWIERLTVAEAI